MTVFFHPRMTIGALAVLLLQSNHVWASASEEDELLATFGDATISLATGNSQTLRRAPAVATVLTAADIAAIGAQNLDDLLSAVPGMSTSRSPIGYFTFYSIRGLGVTSSGSDAQVLVLQNGIPMTTVYSSDKGDYWKGLPVTNIARIEVIRGPGSALYGANAFAGVINIITKTDADIAGTTVGASYGGFNSRDVWVLHGSKIGSVGVAAFLQIGKTDGYNGTIAADAQTLNDSRTGTHASRAPGALDLAGRAINAGFDLSWNKWRFRNSLSLTDELGTGVGVSSSLDPDHELKSARISADLSWTDLQFAKNWGLGFNIAYQHYTIQAPYGLQNFPSGAKLGGKIFPDGLLSGPKRWSKDIRTSAYAIYSGFTSHQLRVGLGHDYDNLYKTDTRKNFLLNAAGVPQLTGPVEDYNEKQPHIRPHKRTNDYIYVQDEWNMVTDWTLTAGLRTDRYSDFGKTTNPRLALVWDSSLNTTVKFLYGRAFRAPSFNEQFNVSPVALGNPGLRPEKITTKEAAISWQARSNLSLNMNLFSYNAEGIIGLVANPAPGVGSTFANGGTQTGKGMELEANWAASTALRISGNYAYQKGTVESTNSDAGYSPRHHIYARADWKFAEGWSFHPQVNLMMDRKRAFGDARPDIRNYKTVDLNLQCKTGKWNFVGAITNLLNADLRVPSTAPGLQIPNDLPLPSRSWYFQASYKL